MQEVPNRAKREAREAGAQARVERERATLGGGAAGGAARRRAGLAGRATTPSAASRSCAELERENRLLQDTLDARIAAGRAMPAERTHGAPGGAGAGRPPRRRACATSPRPAPRCGAGSVRAPTRRSRATHRQLAVSAEHVRAGLHRHAEIAPYARDAGPWPRPRIARGRCRTTRRLGLGADLQPPPRSTATWSRSSSRFDLPWQRDQRQKPQVLARQRTPSASRPNARDMTRRHREELETQLAELQALDSQLRAAVRQRAVRWRPNGWRWRWPATRPAAATSAPC